MSSATPIPMRLSEAVRGEAVEAAGGGDAAGHGDVADREDGEADRRDDEGAGSRPAAAEDGPWIVEQHGRDRRCAGDDAEQHLRQTECVAGEPVHRVDHRRNPP